MTDRFASAPALLAGPALAAAAVLPHDQGWLVATAVIVLLGVPHGALDAEAARDAMRPRLGRSWFPAFAAPYLALSACVLVAWRLAPMPTLAAFLAASVWHFGAEDSDGGGLLEALARGGLPVAAPVLLHPAATSLVFSAIARVPFSEPPPWLWAASLLWLPLAAAWAVREAAAGGWRALRMPALLLALSAALPPLIAFAAYFVCIHAPAHTAGLVRSKLRARRVTSLSAAWVRAAPVTLLTFAIGAALRPLYPGPPAPALLSLVVQGLAALTLPHMLLDAALSARERRQRNASAARSISARTAAAAAHAASFGCVRSPESYRG